MTEHDVTRRSAMTAAGAVVAGGIIGYAVARNSNAAEARKPTTAANAYGNAPSVGKALASVADLSDGGGVVVDHPAVVITRTGSEVHAFSAVCTHQGCLVNKVSDGKIFCPCHGSVFDARTGNVLGGPAPSPLPGVAVTVRGGEVFST
jgi:Rieske Fe-S protein